MDDASLDKLLSGDLNKIPELPKRVVRLFISSTFTDMTLERNSLMERVYPRMKKFCREHHGLDFQVVDMRWGVRDEATDDHQTVNLCSREIDNCKRVSLGPNFIALIGDKYGFRPLLNRIKSTEFRSLRRCLIESDISTDFLDTWYKEDLNAVPAEYLLQPISSILKNFTNKNEPELQMVDQRIWQAIQQRLHELLLIGSSRLVKQGRMSEQEQSLKYSISVTEREVIEGCLDLDETKSHCLVFVRSIVDLRDQLDSYFDELSQIGKDQQQTQSNQQLDPTMATTNDDDRSQPDSRRDSASQTARKASLKIGDDSIQLATSGPQTAAERRLERQRRLISKYIDLASREGTAWQVDEEAQQALEHLREVKLKAKFSSRSRQLKRFEVHWNSQDGVSVKSEEHKRYLDELTEHLYENLTRMIRSAVRSERDKVGTRGLVGEVLQHSHYSLQAGCRVHGRSVEINQIRDYILTGCTRPTYDVGNVSSPPERDRLDSIMPMFVYGISGSGKTSILARVATLAHDWIKQSTARRRSSSAAADQLLAGLSASGHQRDLGQLAGGGRIKWSRRPCVIMRFCCTTPESSSVVGMLKSVCRQLQYNFYQFGPLNGLSDDAASLRGAERGSSSRAGRNPTDQLPCQKIPDDFIRLAYTFRQLLDNCRHSLHKRRTFVILIDSIERLAAPAECSVEAKFSWLTNLGRLPSNVRLIVSCSSSGSIQRELDDYVHLKRHFLRLYLELERASWWSRSPECATSVGSDDSDEPSSPDSVDLNAAEPASSGGQAVARFQFLRRLILPATRMARASRGLIFESNSASAQPAVGRGERPTVRFAMSHGERTQNLAENEANLRRLSSNESLGEGDHNKSRSQQAISSGLLHVKPLGRELAMAVLRRFLAESGRQLTQQQWAIVDKSLAHCSRPIFVKLALGEIVHWKSYTTRGDTRGLVFGSDWLVDFKLPARGETTHQLSQLADRLDAANKTGEDPHLRWQMLAMEQQWLNFLDYKSNTATGSKRGKAGEPDGSSDLVIRIGAAHSTDSQRTKTGSAWSSCAPSSSSSICHLSATIEEAICQLFARIELKHGYLLIKHSLSYITAARNGICENELEDILSLDDVVLDDVFQYHLPPVRRIPPLLWTRIRSDLPDYLSERDADGIVLTWHHNQFKEVTRKRYLTSERQLTYVHSLMADYFLGRWADKPKPFRCTKQQIQLAAEQLESAIQQSMRRDSDLASAGQKRQSSSSGLGRGVAAGIRLGSGSTTGRSGTSFSVRNRLRSSDQHDQRLQWMQAKAPRRVPQQPLYYETESARGHSEPDQERPGVKFSDESLKSAATRRRRYNLRKLTELPHHLLHAGRFLDLARETLFNYRWLFASINALGLQSLFGDLNEAARHLELELNQRQAENETPMEVDSFNADELAVATRDQLSAAALANLRDQLVSLTNTLRLSTSSVHGDPQQLAAQLIGRLLRGPHGTSARNGLPQASALGPPNQTELQMDFIGQLLEQCDRDGCSDCALLPIEHCLQSADGLQLISLEGHPFGILSMRLAADQRHLLAVSSKFLMWNLTTGEVARDVQPKLNGALMRELQLGSRNKFALAYTSNNLVLALEILTQQTSQLDLNAELGKCFEDENDANDSNKPGKSPFGQEQIAGLRLIDEREAKRFFVWTQSGLVIVLKLVELESNASIQQQQQTNCMEISMEYVFRALESESTGGKILEVAIEETNRGSDLVLVLSSTRDQNEMCLSTFQTAHDPLSGHLRTIRCWPSDLRAQLIAWGPSLRQLIVADRTGVKLRRRRAKSWSREKHIIEASSLISSGDDLDGRLLAVELEAGPKVVDLKGEQEIDPDEISSDLYAKLIKFEADLDGDCDEIANLNKAFGESVRNKNDAARKLEDSSLRAAKFLKLYLSNRIAFVQLGCQQTATSANQAESKSNRTFNLVLPRDIRNVRLEPNRSQLMSKTVLQSGPGSDRSARHQVVVVATRRLLFYSLESEQLIRSIEAHSGRITSILVLQTRASNPADSAGHPNSMQLDSSALISSSMDKTVKIWNLMNLNAEASSNEHLSSANSGRGFDSLQLNRQRPLAACLSRGELNLWNWHELKLIARFESVEAMIAECSDRAREVSPSGSGRSPFSTCKFSRNGRHLVLAGFDPDQNIATVALMAVAGPIVQSTTTATASNAKLAPGQEASNSVSLRFVASRTHENCRVSKLKFMSQDSRLLIAMRRLEFAASHSSAEPMRAKQTPAARLQVESLSVPEMRQLYTFECRVPTGVEEVRKEPDRKGLSSKLSDEKRDTRSGRENSPLALTCDQQYLAVLVDAGELKTRPILNVYSARDGQLSKSIDPSHLQLQPGPRSRSTQNSLDSKRSSSNTRGDFLATPADDSLRDFRQLQSRGLQMHEQAMNRVGEINRLKAVASRERQSLVALLDDKRGLSSLLDVSLGQLIAQTNCWTGQHSFDGRFGLSDMFTSATESDETGGTGSVPASSSAGLRLLEMRNFRPVRSLLTSDQFEELMAGAATGNEGGQSSRLERKLAPRDEIVCGFTKPNDAYVYLSQPRSRRLLLLRLRDNQLIANYKLPSEPNRIKCSLDGLALIVGLRDGSLLALAIVDPLASDTLDRLAQYPSRRRRQTVAGQRRGRRLLEAGATPS